MKVALDTDKLRGWREPPIVHAWSAQDTILYALGLGLGHDPLDEAQLRFVTEPRLAALPTLATVLAPRFGWLYRTGIGIDPVRCVHGEQGLTIVRPLPAAGEVVGELAVTRLVDKGPGGPAIVHFTRTLTDGAGVLATLDATMFCRGHGGFRGEREGPPPPPPMPTRTPDAVWSWPTVPQQALIYRRSGDQNPIHADPAVAATAGFPRPILHGLCTYGIAGCLLLQHRLGWDPAALRSLSARFISPVYPGETLLLEAWDEPGGLRFRCRTRERGEVALDQGLLNAAGRPLAGHACGAEPPSGG